MAGTKEKALDDLARLAGGAVSIVSGLGENLRQDVKSRIDETAQRLDLVPREDFDRLEKLVQEQAKKIEALEKELKPKKTKKAASKK